MDGYHSSTGAAPRRDVATPPSDSQPVLTALQEVYRELDELGGAVSGLHAQLTLALRPEGATEATTAGVNESPQCQTSQLVDHLLGQAEIVRRYRLQLAELRRRLDL